MDDENSDKREGKGKIVRTRGSYVEVLETFSNIAPIVDAVLADADDSGQVNPACFVYLQTADSYTHSLRSLHVLEVATPVRSTSSARELISRNWLC